MGDRRERQTGKQIFRFADAHSQAEISTADALPTEQPAAMPPKKKGEKGGPAKGGGKSKKGGKSSDAEPLPTPAAATGELLARVLNRKRSVLASEREVVSIKR